MCVRTCKANEHVNNIKCAVQTASEECGRSPLCPVHCWRGASDGTAQPATHEGQTAEISNQTSENKLMNRMHALNLGSMTYQNCNGQVEASSAGRNADVHVCVVVSVFVAVIVVLQDLCKHNPKRHLQSLENHCKNKRQKQ